MASRIFSTSWICAFFHHVRGGTVWLFILRESDFVEMLIVDEAEWELLGVEWLICGGTALRFFEDSDS